MIQLVITSIAGILTREFDLARLKVHFRIRALQQPSWCSMLLKENATFN